MQTSAVSVKEEEEEDKLSGETTESDHLWKAHQHHIYVSNFFHHYHA